MMPFVLPLEQYDTVRIGLKRAPIRKSLLLKQHPLMDSNYWWRLSNRNSSLGNSLLVGQNLLVLDFVLDFMLDFVATSCSHCCGRSMPHRQRAERVDGIY